MVFVGSSIRFPRKHSGKGPFRAGNGLRGPSTGLRAPSTRLRTPSTRLRTPATRLRTPSTRLRVPATRLRPRPHVYAPRPHIYDPRPHVYEPRPHVYDPRPHVSRSVSQFPASAWGASIARVGRHRNPRRNPAKTFRSNPCKLPGPPAAVERQISGPIRRDSPASRTVRLRRER